MANGWRDSRFGQFADPNFGASLAHAGRDEGVLPDTEAEDADTSATSAGNAGVVYNPNPVGKRGAPPDQISFGNDALRAPEDEALLATDRIHEGRALPDFPTFDWGGLDALNFEEGGAVDAQDTGNAQPESTDPFSFVAQALNHGRKKFNLLGMFGGEQRQPSPRAKEVADAVAMEGSQPQDRETDVEAIMRNRVMRDMNVGDVMNYGNTRITKDQPETLELAEGGMIPDGSEPTQEGSDPTQMIPNGGADQRAIMAYLSGQGGVPPDMAMAIERRVDPQGTMDPSERKLRAIASAPDPDKAFGLMQYYRSKFNGYSAFAQAAMTGAGGRPPNGMAAAEALTKAYENVPDGRSVQFQPVPGGMKVAVRKIIPSRPAPSGGEDNSMREQPKPVKRFEEGGVVEDEYTEDTGFESQGARPWAGPAGAAAAQEAVAQAPERGPIEEAMGGKPHEVVREFVLSIPQLLGWVKKDGQFDSVSDRGVENTIPVEGPEQAAAPEAAPTVDPNAPPTSAAAQHPLSPAGAPRRPGPIGFQQNVRGQGNADWHTPTPEQAVANAAQEPTLKEALHQIDLAYGNFTGQAREKALAKAMMIKEWHKANVGVTREHVRGGYAGERNAASNEAKLGVAQTHADAGMERARIQAQAQAERELQRQYGREQIERMRQTGQWDRMVQQETQKAMRTILNVDPRAARNPDRLNQSMQGLPQVAPQAPGQTGQAPAAAAPQMTQAPALPPAALSALKENQVTTFKNGQKWTLKGGKPVQVQ